MSIHQTRVRVQPYAWLAVIGLAFAAVYLRSLTFVYIEGDDAASIAYHLFGRNSALQNPYDRYHSMMDVVLGVLPTQEPLLRITAMLISALAAVSMLVMMLLLVFDWLKDVNSSQKRLIAGVVLLASPEFLYFGLLFNPTAVAMSLILAGHLLLRQVGGTEGWPSFAGGSSRLKAIIALALFGIGVAFRWSAITYGAVIVADLIVGGGIRRDALAPLRTRVIFGAVWGMLALVAALLVILSTGYAPSEFASEIIAEGTHQIRFWLENFRQSGVVRSGVASFEVFRVGAILQTLVTPAFGVLALAGFVTLLRRRDPLLVVVLVGIASAAQSWPRGVTKFIITAVPGLVMCSVVGFQALWYGIEQKRPRVVARVALGGLMLAPWLVGVRILDEGSAHGPGFGLRPFDREEIEGTHISLAVGAGAEVSTAEGSRPLFGHGWALLGGEWRDLMSGEAAVRRELVEQAIASDIPLVITRWSPSYFENELIRMGYTTADPSRRLFPPNSYFRARRFVDDEGHEVTVLYHGITAAGTAGTQEDMRQLSSLPFDAVAFGAYPRTLRHVYELSPEALEGLGPRAAVMDITAFRDAIDETPVNNGNSGS